MGCGASAQAPSPESIKTQQRPAAGNAGSKATTNMGEVDDNYEMDDEVAQQTAELLFDLLPYYDTGNEEADQIFLATLQAQSMCPELHGRVSLTYCLLRGER